jgi:hypothetical protein
MSKRTLARLFASVFFLFNLSISNSALAFVHPERNWQCHTPKAWVLAHKITLLAVDIGERHVVSIEWIDESDGFFSVFQYVVGETEQDGRVTRLHGWRPIRGSLIAKDIVMEGVARLDTALIEGAPMGKFVIHFKDRVLDYTCHPDQRVNRVK